MATDQLTDLLDVLLDAGHVSEQQKLAAEAEATAEGKSPIEVLVQQKVIDDEMLTKARGTVFGLPYVDLQNKDVDRSILDIIPQQVSENNKAIAFEKDEDTVSVGMVDPRDSAALQAIDFLAQANSFRPKYHIISEAGYNHASKKYAAIGKDVESALAVAEEKFTPEEKEVEVTEEKIEEIIKGAPVSRIVSVILKHAVDGNASDIHIEPLGDETRVRYRVDGMLRSTLTLPKYIHPSLVSRIKVLSNLKLDETRIPQDGRIRETFGTKIIDFRVSTLPLSENEKVVMRILDTTKGVPKLEKLGFRERYVEIINEEIMKPHGMFLITGPTGSGKSTTLMTILNMRNEEGVNISTLEDPVEYNIKGVNQSQMRPDVGFTFSAGLRALLRQDPNIIMVGEVRDGETGELAIHAALTGHLIFSTLHTNDAFGVVPRLTDMHLEPFLLGATMNVAIAQRLARRICDRCKAPSELPDDMEARVREELSNIPASYLTNIDVSTPKLKFFKGMGCVRCGDTGYSGRVAIAEVIQYGTEMRKLIIEGFPIEKVQKQAKEQGMINLREDALLKALEGFTTMEEVMRLSAE